jgi:hypothetical protein
MLGLLIFFVRSTTHLSSRLPACSRRSDECVAVVTASLAVGKKKPPRSATRRPKENPA